MIAEDVANGNALSIAQKLGDLVSHHDRVATAIQKALDEGADADAILAAVISVLTRTQPVSVPGESLDSAEMQATRAAADEAALDTPPSL
jgi:hypothetical protein